MWWGVKAETESTGSEERRWIWGREKRTTARAVLFSTPDVWHFLRVSQGQEGWVPVNGTAATVPQWSLVELCDSGDAHCLQCPIRCHSPHGASWALDLWLVQMKNKIFQPLCMLQIFPKKNLGKAPMPRTLPQINGFNWSGMGPGCQYFVKLPVMENPDPFT